MRADALPCLFDRTATTGFDRHYIYHPAWAARAIAITKPTLHYDISSILHFSAILSAFVPVVFLDYRPAALKLSNLQCGSADLTRLPLPDGSINSLSCMHTLEHVGLGRYGDPVNPFADAVAARELARVLAPGGNLFVVVPVGKERTMFNAHRVYAMETVLKMFPSLCLVETALIRESGDEGLIFNPKPSEIAQETYGCGCFWFTKGSSQDA